MFSEIPGPFDPVNSLFEAPETVGATKSRAKNEKPTLSDYSREKLHEDPSMDPISTIFDLSGQVAAVTGGNRGIGRQIALRLAEAGASVMIIDRDAGQETVDEIGRSGGNAQWVQADISDVAAARQAIEATVTELGDIHILVNNAGIFPIVPFLELTEEVWDLTFDINLKSAAFCIQAAAQAMIDAGHGGKIINIGSESSIRPAVSGLSHYTASKGGMEALTRSVGRELLPHGIRVNLVAPGHVITVDRDKIPAEYLEHEKYLPTGRSGDPDDIAKVVLFMACHASDYIIGQTVVADGGILWLAKLEGE